jgi:ribonuclease HII
VDFLEGSPLFDSPYLQRFGAVCGVDEAGRGPMAGPLVAGAVVFTSCFPELGVNDSKVLSSIRRDRLYEEIIACAQAWGVGIVKVSEMSFRNMHQATLLAMRRAIHALVFAPPVVLLDGQWILSGRQPFHQEAIINGDAKSAAIAAGSILAKVTRDRLMEELDRAYPNYGFARHKGYCTVEHMQALARLGPCLEHRRRFAPVAAYLEQIPFPKTGRPGR